MTGQDTVTELRGPLVAHTLRRMRCRLAGTAQWTGVSYTICDAASGEFQDGGLAEGIAVHDMQPIDSLRFRAELRELRIERRHDLNSLRDSPRTLVS